MSLTTQTDLIQYTGNGVATAFAYPYLFSDSADIVVVLTNTTTKVDTIQAITTNYTVAGATVPAGGTITMLVAPTASQQVTIYRSVPRTQPLDYVTQDDFPAESHEGALDRLTMLVQEAMRRLDRCLRLPSTNSVLPELTVSARRGMSLGFDSSGNLTLATGGEHVNISITSFTGGLATSLDNVAIAPYPVSAILTIQPSGPGNALIRVQKVNTTAAAVTGVIIRPLDYNASTMPYQWVVVG